MLNQKYLLGPCACVLAIALVTGWASSNPSPPEPPYGISRSHELRKGLKIDYGLGRHAAVQQLRRLGPGRIALVEEALASEYEDVQRAAIAALGTIGNDVAKQHLLKVFQDSTANLGIRIAAAEALADIRDSAVIPALRQAIDEVTDKCFREYVSRAIDRIGSHLVDAPIIDFRDGVVWFRFLLDDIADIRVIDDRSGEVHRFAPGQFQTICNLLQRGRTAEVGMLIEVREMHIELKDGRVANLGLDGNKIVYKDWSRYWHRWHFTMTNPDLIGFVNRSMQRHAEATRGPRP